MNPVEELIKDYSLYNPSLIYNPNDLNTPYKMWYSKDNGFHLTIRYATSKDGKIWNKYGTVLDIGNSEDFDSKDVYSPSVIYDPNNSENPYKIYYGGHSIDHMRIGYATSKDGINWVKHGVILDSANHKNFDDYNVDDPTVIYDPNNLDTPYKMWYSKYDGSYWRIEYATSKDGISWNKHGIALNPGAPGDFDDRYVYVLLVIHNPNDSNAPYKMWYTGRSKSHNAIGCAISKDGINWTKQRNEI